MKRIGSMVVMVILFFSAAWAEDSTFTKMPKGEPELIQQGPDRLWCPVCGMSLKAFYKTSHGVVLSNGDKKQYCSIRCLAVDYPTMQSSLDQVLVVDLKTERLMDARKAHYIIGSEVPGTMSRVSKLAFSDEASATAFQAKMGGRPGSFQTAFAEAQKSLQPDNAMTDKKKKTKMYSMGEKIFSKLCSQKIDPAKFDRINALKAAIISGNRCQPLKEVQLQAVALYLWDVKRLEGSGSTLEGLRVDKDEKCPVCGMFVYKYPRWTAQLFVMQDGKARHYSFDGVKDLMTYYLEPTAWGAPEGQVIRKIMVTDYYSQKGIDGKQAFYVIGSDVYGPMGNELIPFATGQQAQTFLKDHHGKKIVRFDEISKDLLMR